MEKIAKSMREVIDRMKNGDLGEERKITVFKGQTCGPTELCLEDKPSAFDEWLEEFETQLFNASGVSKERMNRDEN